MKFLYLIWGNLKRKKTRTVLTGLSILVAFILYGYLAAIRQAFAMGIEVAGADRLMVRHKVSIIQSLPQSYQARIAGLDGVDAVTHASWFGGIYQEPKNFFPQHPVVPEEYLDLYPEFLLPEDQKQAWLKTRTGAVVGRGTAERFGFKIGDKVPIQATIWAKQDGGRTWEFDIVGIYDGAKKGTDNTQFLFRYDYFDEARGIGKGQVGWYMVRVKDPDRAAAIAKAIDDLFANSPFETKAETEAAFVQGFANQVGNIGAIMMAIMSAVFFTILLVAGNTMGQSVRERLQEIGVLKSLGFTHGQVLGLVLGESCCLALIGGGIGLALSWVLIAGGDPTKGFLPLFYFPVQDLIAGAVLVLVLGLAAGILPALQAQRLSVANALRRS